MLHYFTRQIPKGKRRKKEPAKITQEDIDNAIDEHLKRGGKIRYIPFKTPEPMADISDFTDLLQLDSSDFNGRFL